MANPAIIDIPHTLGREEVKRRMQARIGELPAHIPGGIADIQSSWPEAHSMAIEVAALGQRITATLDAHETFVRMTLALPPALSFMAGAIEQAIRRKAPDLLLTAPD